MSRTSRIRFAGLALALSAGAAAFAGFSPSAHALVGPSGLVNAPEYCVAIYGDPSPCPPPDRPDPVTCLRVDIEPLRCPYQP